MISRYDLMQNFNEVNSDNYRDIYNFPIDNFVYTINPEKYVLTTADVDRIDLLMFRVYENAAWDDIILWLNGISSVYELSPGDEIILPSIIDLTSFYNQYLKG